MAARLVPAYAGLAGVLFSTAPVVSLLLMVPLTAMCWRLALAFGNRR